MRPKMVKLAKRKILPIKIAPSQQPQQSQQSENNYSEMRNSRFFNPTTPFTQNLQCPPYEEPKDLPGVLAITRKLNQECMQMMANMRTVNLNFNTRLGEIEVAYRRKINDLSIRVKVLEIMYVNQDKELDAIKNILNTQLQCTNTLTYSLLNMNQSNQVNGAEPVSLISPQQIQAQDPFLFNEDDEISTAGSVRSNTEENYPQNQEQNTLNPGARRCEFCSRTFATDKYLCLHQMRIPKYCARKRTRLLSQQERQENAKRSKSS